MLLGEAQGEEASTGLGQQRHSVSLWLGTGVALRLPSQGQKAHFRKLAHGAAGNWIPTNPEDKTLLFCPPLLSASAFPSPPLSFPLATPFFSEKRDQSVQPY